MRFFRRVIAVAFIVALMISSMAFAQEDFNGDMTIEEGAAVFVESDEARLLRLSKEAAVENDIQSRVNRNRDGYTILNVTPFQQETDHYCGPATVKQVVHYIMGSSYSQDYYADCLETTTDGTDMTVIPGVLNTAIGQNYYVYDPIDSETEWYTEIAQALEYDMPPVLDINTSGLTAYFPYSTTGHFVNVSGNDPITSDGDGYYFRITDPATGSNTWYLKSILYQANVNHFRSAYIW